MPCLRHDIKIVQRSNRQSAVAAAAYQIGDRLFSEYDQKQKYYSACSQDCAGIPREIPSKQHADLIRDNCRELLFPKA